MASTSSTITAVFACIFLVACGGGSGSTTTSASLDTSSSIQGSASLGNNTNGTGNTSGNTGSTSTGNILPSSGAPASTFDIDETARLNTPGDITVDNAGNLYVMDRGNQAIRRIASTGQVSTLPGSYQADSKLAIDPSGNLFVLTGIDLFKITPDGNKTLVASYPQSPGSYHPIRISLDAAGRLYLLQQYRNVFRVDRIGPDNSSNQPGVYSFSTFGSVTDLASDAQGNLALGSIGPVEGTSRVTWIPQSAQPAEESSPGVSSWPIHLNNVGKMAFDAAGNLYIADATYTFSGSVFSVSDMRVIKVTHDGTVRSVLNGFPDGGTANPQTTSLNNNIGITVARNGDLYISEPFTHAIYKINSSGQIVLIAGKPGEPGNADQTRV